MTSVTVLTYPIGRDKKGRGLVRAGESRFAAKSLCLPRSRGADAMATLQTKSVRRREDLRLLTGRGNYAADAAPAGMGVATFLRSPYAHARIEHIDAEPARWLPGVIAVYTAADLTDVAPIAGGIGFP